MALCGLLRGGQLRTREYSNDTISLRLWAAGSGVRTSWRVASTDLYTRAHYAVASRAWDVRPVARARRLRPRLYRRPPPSPEPRRGPKGGRNPAATRSPWCCGVRSLHESRRRGHPAPHPARALRACSRSRRNRAPERGRLRRCPVFSLARRRHAREGDQGPRRRGPPSQPKGDRLARRPGRRAPARSGRAVDDAPSCGNSSSGACAPVLRVRADAALHDPQAGPAAGRPRRGLRASTSRAFRRGQSSTRASRCPSGSTRSTSTFAKKRRRASSRSSTRASAPTRFRRGGARAPRIAASLTTAKLNTLRAATRRGCARARRCSRARPSASTSRISSRSSGRAAATRPRSTTWSISSSQAGAACPTS